LHNTEFRIDSCSPQLLQSIDMRQKGAFVPNGSGVVAAPSGGIQFDSTQPKIPSVGLSQPAVKVIEAGSK
jgi:hypothetical protein